jgi:hypothetical protein
VQVLERRREPSGGSDLAVTLLASVSIAVPLLFYLHQHVEMLRYGYEIEHLKERRAQLSDRRQELVAERAEGASLGRIEHQASLIGLVAPEPLAVYATGGPALEGDHEPDEKKTDSVRTARLE